MNLAGSDRVELTGTMPKDTVSIAGISTTGSGSENCQPSWPSPEEPKRFTLQCPVETGDSAAVIDLTEQLADGMHDPARQRLFEVYSGHGASEVFVSQRDQVTTSDGASTCAPPSV